MRPRERGAALLLMVVVLLSLAAGLTLAAARDLVGAPLVREASAAAELRLARDALLGAAHAAWCLDPTLSPAALLPCPDTGGAEGEAADTCAAVSRGWLPWKTLNLPPLRDASGTCLWYERAGSGARVVAAGPPGPGQMRSALATRPECGGSHVAAAYLDAGDPALDFVVDVAALATACTAP